MCTSGPQTPTSGEPRGLLPAIQFVHPALHSSHTVLPSPTSPCLSSPIHGFPHHLHMPATTYTLYRPPTKLPPKIDPRQLSLEDRSSLALRPVLHASTLADGNTRGGKPTKSPGPLPLTTSAINSSDPPRRFDIATPAQPHSPMIYEQIFTHEAGTSAFCRPCDLFQFNHLPLKARHHNPSMGHHSIQPRDLYNNPGVVYNPSNPPNRKSRQDATSAHYFNDLLCCKLCLRYV